MPPSFSFFSIRSYTILVLVDSDLNMIQGDLLHMDWSTTTTNTNSFNGGFMPTRQPSPPALPREPTLLASHNASAERHDADRPSSSSDTPSHLPSIRGSRPVPVPVPVSPNRTVSNSSTLAETSSPLGVEHPSHRHYPFGEAFELQAVQPHPHLTLSCTSDDRALSNQNIYTCACKKLKDWFKKALNYLLKKLR